MRPCSLVLVGLAAGGCSASARESGVAVVEIEKAEPRGTTVAPEGAKRDGPDCSERLEDGEDGDNQVLLGSGRSGYVYTYLDPEGSTVNPPPGNYGGVFVPSPGGARGSTRALRFHGSLIEGPVVYAGLALNLLEPRGPYDASNYSGISFWARSGEGAGHVELELPDGNTDPAGGRCSSCYNDFGKRVDLGETWQRFLIRFDELEQEPGWGVPRPEEITRKALYAIHFQVAEPGPYDVWIDEIALCER